MKRAIAGTTLAALLATMVPAAPALADGRASTRNILFGAAAATYLIIQHNRKVHAKYAEDARRQAELQSENNDAWAAYSSEKRAYANETAEIVDLKREVSYQHNIIVQQRHQLAMAGRSSVAPQQRVAFVQGRHHAPVRPVQHAARGSQVAMVSYGWGSL